MMRAARSGADRGADGVGTSRSARARRHRAVEPVGGGARESRFARVRGEGGGSRRRRRVGRGRRATCATSVATTFCLVVPGIRPAGRERSRPGARADARRRDRGAEPTTSSSAGRSPMRTTRSASRARSSARRADLADARTVASGNRRQRAMFALCRARGACVYSPGSDPRYPGLDPNAKERVMALPVLTPEQRTQALAKAARGAEEARGAEGRAEVRQEDAEGRAVRVGRRHRRQDEGVQRARVAPRRRQGARPEAHGGARHLREPPRPRTRREAARDAPRPVRQEVSRAGLPARASSSSSPAPRGSARGRVVRRLLDRDPDGLVRLGLGHDPRPRARASEDGVDYLFIVRRRRSIGWSRTGELLEWAEIFGHRSGTPARPSVEDRSLRAATCILEIDVKGAGTVRERGARRGPDLPRAARPWRSWSGACGAAGPRTRSGSPGAWTTAAWEMEQRDWFDHVVVNDDLERAADEVAAIIEASRSEPCSEPP